MPRVFVYVHGGDSIGSLYKETEEELLSNYIDSLEGTDKPYIYETMESEGFKPYSNDVDLYRWYLLHLYTYTEYEVLTSVEEILDEKVNNFDGGYPGSWTEV